MGSRMIDSLQLSVRAENALKRSGVFFVGQLLQLTDKDIGEMRNIGIKTAKEVMEKRDEARNQGGEKLENVHVLHDMVIDFAGFPLPMVRFLKEQGIYFVGELAHSPEELLYECRSLDRQAMRAALFLYHTLQKDCLAGEEQEKEAGRPLPHLYYWGQKNTGDEWVYHAFPSRETKPILYVFFSVQGSFFSRRVPIEMAQFDDHLLGILRVHKILWLDELAALCRLDMRRWEGISEEDEKTVETYLRKHAVVIYGEDMDLWVEQAYQSILAATGADVEHLIFDMIRYKLYRNQERVKRWYLQGEFQYSPELTEGIRRWADKKEIYAKSVQEYLNAHGELDMVKAKQLFPEDVLMVEEILVSMQKRAKVEQVGTVYRSRRMTLRDWQETLDDRTRELLRMRLSGKTLQECGDAVGITRERVRQVLGRAFRQKPLLVEDEWAYWHETYSLHTTFIRDVLGGDEEAISYFRIFYKRGAVPEEEVENDPRLMGVYRERYETWKRRKFVRWCDTWIIPQKSVLWLEALRVLSANESLPASVFVEKYHEMLQESGLYLDSYRFFSLRMFLSMAERSRNLLWTRGQRIRYYPIHHVRVLDLLERIDWTQYEDSEISAQKIHRDYPELMAEHDLRDGYELHNFLSKTKRVWMNKEVPIVLGRMPFLSVGEGNRNRQVEDLLWETAPIDLEDFARLYEERYGVLAATVKANFLDSIQQYYHRGRFVLDRPDFTAEEAAWMKEYFSGDLYFIEDVETIFVSQFGEDRRVAVNPLSLKGLDFKVYRNYILKGTHPSAHEYFRQYFLSQSSIDFVDGERRFLYVQTALQVLDELVSEFVFLEEEPRRYKKFEYFRDKLGIEKEECRQFVKDVEAYIGEDRYFTVVTLERAGIFPFLEKVGLFLAERVLTYDPTFSVLRTKGRFLFIKKGERGSMETFLERVATSREFDTEEELDRYLRLTYGLDPKREKLRAVLSDISQI